jgi:SWI/SNF-related matrix-associated actin-dependent regulator of chromatin subfamily A-like protein 1
MNRNKLLVNVASHKRSYMLKFAKNEELIARIKQQENAKWDTTTFSWILGAKALIKVITSYKGREDIFFNFTIDGLREKFIQDIAKEAKKEAEELLKNGAKLEEYKRHKALKEHLETVADTLTLPDGFNKDFKPYPHQLVAAHFLNEIKSGMLLLEMGLGKTAISIIFAEMQGDKFKKVLVVTPNSLKYNYKNEVEKFTSSKAYVYQGLTSKKGIAAELEAIKEAKYIIVNYEYFNAKPVPATKSERKDNARYFDKKKKFDNIGLPVKSIDCVICDESHKLKNEESNTTRNFIRTLGKKESIVLMTGTPAPSRIEELFTALHMIAPTLIKKKSDYYSNYCGLRNDEGTFGWVQDSPPKLKEIYELMSPFSIRKRKEDVLKDLPEKQVTRIVIELTSSDLKAYEEVERGIAFDMFGELKRGNSINAMTTLLRLRQFTSMLKVKYMKEIFDRLLDENEKFVVFDASVETLKVMYEQYKDLSVLHIGDIDTLTRSELVKVFQEDDSCLIFFGSNATCNAGLTLTAANKLFQMQQPYTVGENDQLNDRIHRIGQKNNCNIYIPILKDTIDEMVYYLVENKRKNLSLAIDNIEYERNRNQMFVNDLITKFKQKYKGLD